MRKPRDLKYTSSFQEKGKRYVYVGEVPDQFGPKEMRALAKWLLKAARWAEMVSDVKLYVYYLPEYDVIQLKTFPDWTCEYVLLGEL